MKSNPLVAEVLVGLAPQGKAQLDYLTLLSLQAAVLFVSWPKEGLGQALANQHGPNTLAAVVMALGLTMAYYAVRAGAEETMLPGQHGPRDWALATPLRCGRIVRGYVLAQLAHSLHQLALSLPLLLMAFTVSGGEWAALGWCVVAALVQAVFYRLCGALTHIAIGQHRAESRFAVRMILVLVYVPIGWLAPVTSHIALSSRLLGESVERQPLFAAVPDPVVFLAGYGGLSVLAAVALHRLLARERRAATGMHGSGRANKATTG